MPHLPEQQIAIALSSKTGTQVSDKIENFGFRGVRVGIYRPTSPGNGSITVTINEMDAMGQKNNLLTSAALTGAGNTYLTVYPTITAVPNSIAQNSIGRVFEIDVADNNGSTLIYGIGVSLLP